ncbi:MAG: hypothetical protein J6S98_00960, partial [Lentisphaeria bacterium]|nr:hypothetical protein [Lentisphaeria bacterium]
IDGSLMRGTFDYGVVTIKVPVTYGESVLDTTLTASDFRIFNITAATTLKNMIVKGGKFTGDGGAIYASKSLTLDTVQVMDSYASNWGGGVCSTAASTFYNCTIYNNTSAVRGGGVCTTNAALTFFNTFFYGNQSNEGGAVGIDNCSEENAARFFNCTITGNTTTKSASGAVHGRQARANFYSSIILGNKGSANDVYMGQPDNSYIPYVYDSIYGKITTTSTSNVLPGRFQNSYNATVYQVFGDNTIYQDSKGFFTLDILDQGAASWGGKIYAQIKIPSSLDTTSYNNNTKMYGYFDEDGYFRTLSGKLVAFSGANNSNPGTADYFSNDDGKTWYTDEACTDEFTEGYLAGGKYSTTTPRRNMIMIKRDGIEQVFPELGTLTYKGIKNGVPDTVFATWYTEFKYDRNGTDRSAEQYIAMGTTAHDSTLDRLTDLENNLTVTSEGTAIDATDGVITLNEALIVANRLGTAEITFADTVSEIVISTQISVNTNMTFTAAEGQDITLRTAVQGVADDGTYDSTAANTNRLFLVSYQGKLTLNNITLSGGKISGSGAIIYADKAATITLNGSTLENGYTTGSGGAIYLQNAASLIATDSSFNNNRANNGGAIYLQNAASLIATDSSFNNNRANNGGAIYVLKDSTVSIDLTGSVFDSNNAATSGAAIFAASGTITISGNSFTENRAASNRGGALYLENVTTDIRESSFIKNKANNFSFDGGGGAIHLQSGTLNISRSLFDGNEMESGNWNGIKGGAVSSRSGSVFIDNSTFINQVNGVFAATNTGANFTIVNSTIYGNGNSAFFQSSDNMFTVINSLIGNNGYDFHDRDGGSGILFDRFYNTISTGTISPAASTTPQLTDKMTILSAADFKAMVEEICFDADGKLILNPILGKTITFNSDSAAAQNGVLVGKIGKAYYYTSIADGSKWISAADGTETEMVFTMDAATNYGLGTEDGTEVFTADQNNLDRFMLNGKLTIGASNARQESLVVNTDSDEFNPYDTTITLREAIDL